MIYPAICAKKTSGRGTIIIGIKCVGIEMYKCNIILGGVDGMIRWPFTLLSCFVYTFVVCGNESD